MAQNYLRVIDEDGQKVAKNTACSGEVSAQAGTEGYAPRVQTPPAAHR
jgi:hypothetical protein